MKIQSNIKNIIVPRFFTELVIVAIKFYSCYHCLASLNTLNNLRLLSLLAKLLALLVEVEYEISIMETKTMKASKLLNLSRKYIDLPRLNNFKINSKK